MTLSVRPPNYFVIIIIIAILLHFAMWLTLKAGRTRFVPIRRLSFRKLACACKYTFQCKGRLVGILSNDISGQVLLFTRWYTHSENSFNLTFTSWGWWDFYCFNLTTTCLWSLLSLDLRCGIMTKYVNTEWEGVHGEQFSSICCNQNENLFMWQEGVSAVHGNNM